MNRMISQVIRAADDPGDTRLAHVSAVELAWLQRYFGGSVNSQTGLWQFGDTKKLTPAEKKAAADKAKQKEKTKLDTQKKTYAQADKVITKAYQDVLGRNPTTKELNNWRGSAAWYSDLQLMKTQIAQSAGKNPTKFGDTVVDPAKLTKGTKEYDYYQVWKKKFGNRPMYQSILNNWARYGVNTKQFEAGLSKQVQHGVQENETTGKITPYTIYTKDAVKTMGGSLGSLINRNKGEVVIVPKGTSVGRNWTQVDNTNKSLADYDIYYGTGEGSRGLWGNALRAVTGSDSAYNKIMKGMPNWVPLVFGGGSTQTGMVWGKWGADKAREEMSDAGLSDKTIQKITTAQDRLQQIAVTTLSQGSPWTSWLGPAYSAWQQASYKGQGADISEAKIWTTLGKGLFNTYVKTPDEAKIVTDTLWNKAKGGNWEDALKDAAYDYASGKTGGLSNFGRAELEKDYTWKQAIQDYAYGALQRGLTAWTGKGKDKTTTWQKLASTFGGDMARYAADIMTPTKDSPKTADVDESQTTAWDRAKEPFTSLPTRYRDWITKEWGGIRNKDSGKLFGLVRPPSFGGTSTTTPNVETYRPSSEQSLERELFDTSGFGAPSETGVVKDPRTLFNLAGTSVN